MITFAGLASGGPGRIHEVLRYRSDGTTLRGLWAAIGNEVRVAHLFTMNLRGAMNYPVYFTRFCESTTASLVGTGITCYLKGGFITFPVLSFSSSTNNSFSRR
jgi:hypothetical protein